MRTRLTRPPEEGPGPPAEDVGRTHPVGPMNQALAESQASLLGGEMFQQFIDTATIGFAVQGADETVLYVNAHLARMLGYDDPEELVGADSTDFITAEALEEYRSHREMWPTGSIPMHGLTLRRKDGGVVRTLVTPYPVLDGKGELVMAAAFVVDIKHLLDAGASRTATDPDQPSLAALTEREREIVTCLVQGKSVREIAEANFISTHTVRNHIKSVYRKLGVHTRLDLMRAVIGTPESEDDTTD